MAHPTFNLVEEPWIPVATKNGNTELSLRDLFARAHEVKGFNEPSPLTYVSVARFLLAITHRALNGPESPDEWVELWQKGRFDPAPFEDYVATWRHRFDLFDPEKPFAQAPLSEFSPTEKTKPLSKLALELASGTNPTLFDHTSDDGEVFISPAEATRMLLAAMNYGFGEGGIYRDTTLVRFMSFLVEGESLFETLLLNLQTYVGKSILGARALPNLDAPWWETDAPLTETKDETLPLGLTDHLTRRGRKVHLQLNDNQQIVGMLYRPGIAFDSSRERSDPFFAWRTSKDGSLTPMRFRLGRALWRDSEVLFQWKSDEGSGNAVGIRPSFLDHLEEVAIAMADRLELHDDTKPLPHLKIMAFGVLPKSGRAAVDLWRMEQLPLPVALLRNRELVATLRVALEFAEDAARALKSAGRRLAMSLLTEGDRSPDKNDVANQLSQLRLDERFWPPLELQFHRFLTDLDGQNREERLFMWMDEVLRLTKRAYDDAAHVVGVDARSLKAQMMGLRTLHRGLKELQEQHDQKKAYVEGDIAS